jgi:hypothetical protein
MNITVERKDHSLGDEIKEKDSSVSATERKNSSSVVQGKNCP